jgi:hypothetical protein
MTALATRFFTALSRVQHRSAPLILLGAIVVSAVSLPWVLELRLNSDFQAMLPESSRSVRDLDEIRERFGGTSTLTLAIQDTRTEGADVEALRQFTRALAAELEGFDAELEVVRVDWNVRDFYDFVREHQHLYADLADLTEVRDALQARITWERNHANPFYLDLDDTPPPDPEAVLERIREDAAHAEREMDRFPEGFYQHPELPLIFVFLRTSIRGGAEGSTNRLLVAVEEAAGRALAHEGLPAASRSRTNGTDSGLVAGHLRIDYGGDLMDILEETEALKEAVALSTLITLILLLVSIHSYYHRWRALPLLVLNLLAPILFTFGVTQPVVGSLNTSSAFLASIVIGNGVNSSIMWLGRYFEERRQGRDLPDAIREAHLGTWQGTLAAAFAAALAYGSLAVTDYRGFRDFGLIGLVGMLSCWLATYTVLPALATLLERRWPMTFEGKDQEHKGIYGQIFARLSLASPRTLLAVSALATLVTLSAIVFAAQSDPLEYDFRNLQAERPPESRVRWVNNRLEDWADETLAGSAVAILAPTNEDVPFLVEQLDAYRAEHPEAFGAVRTIDDLLPHDQDLKLAVLADLRRLMLEVRPYLTDVQQADIDAHLPPETVAVVGLDDLPASVARSFTERDGSRGRLVFIEHAEGRTGWDGRYQIEWARGARSARARDGTEPAVAGAAVVFADLISSIFSEAPLAMGASFVTVLVLVLFSFSRMRERLYALVAMLLGVVWMTGTLALMAVKLNFLNMMAFPITFGIGLEYAVNYLKRYGEERDGGRAASDAVKRALEGAGGAVVLCSLTTLIGYISLYTSSNQALNSFGLAMSLGEVTCLLASVAALPALLVAIEGRGEHRPKEAPGGEEVSKAQASE